MEIASRALGLLEQEIGRKSEAHLENEEHEAHKKNESKAPIEKNEPEALIEKNESEARIEKNEPVRKSETPGDVPERSTSTEKRLFSISRRDFALALICALLALPVVETLRVVGQWLWDGAQLFVLPTLEIVRTLTSLWLL